MPTLDISGAYVGVESLKAAIAPAIADTTRDALILEHLLAATADFNRQVDRRFFPVTAKATYRWPPYYVAWTWELWTEDDLLSVSLLQSQAGGQNASPTTLTHYFLEPQALGPPYNRIEIDLSSSDVFTAGSTPQQSVAVTGQWGYCATTRAAGTLAAAITTTTATTLSCSSAALIDQGDVLLIDSEAIFVDAPRGIPTTTLTIVRGVNGTTPATHLNAAPIVKYMAPANVRRLIRADAIGTLQQDMASWGRTIGQGEMAVEYQAKQQKSLRQQLIDQYARRRTAAV